MQWYVLIILIVVALTALGLCLYFFQIKNEEIEEQLESSKDRIDEMVSNFDILIELAKDNEKIKTNLEDVQDSIRYSNPSENKKVAEYDKRIADRVGDLKLKLAMAKTKGSYHGAKRLLSEIELLLVERNTFAK